MNISVICKALQFDGHIIKYEILHGGNINTTYKVTCKNDNGNADYLLQRINKNVFKNPEGIMSNIVNVTEYISSKANNFTITPLKFLKSKDGKAFIIDEYGDFWRARQFLDCVCFDITDELPIINEAGKAFGEFERMLDGFDASTLFECIPDFHNTVKRFESLEKSIIENKFNRKNECAREIKFLYDNRQKSSILISMLNSGDLPIRVTHNDTKCNNVVFDKNTLKALAVIDLDTIMPGLVAYDFGDGARSICSTSLEDEKDLNKVCFDLERFDAFASGYISVLRDCLSETEIKSLTESVFVMTFELAVRFLEDYLNGDTYFKTRYEKHNLIRARCQIALCKDILSKTESIRKIINKYSK